MDWQSILRQISTSLIQNGDLNDEFKDSSFDWLGAKGTSDSEMEFHEKRLNATLPPSYKEFLKVSNGFKQLNTFVWNILPVDQIDWLKKFDPDLYELYTIDFKDDFSASDEEYFVYGDEQKTTDFRSEYLANSLAISGWGDASILLLNPNVKFGREWEAWMFATWHLGPVRYKSFEELVLGEYSSYLDLRKSNN